MAAKAGQILQAELLVVYGADPGAPDINGRTPMDYARYRAGGNRLPVCVYEQWGGLKKKADGALCSVFQAGRPRGASGAAGRVSVRAHGQARLLPLWAASR